MNAVIETLLKLQTLEFGRTPSKSDQEEIAALRASVPETILGHYDRLTIRGKKGVALIRNQVCSGCQMRLPIGTITTLMRDQDIQLCDSCGRYLYLPHLSEEPVAEVKLVKQPRRKKAVV